MEFNRKQFSCALIPKGPDGNPTVAICKMIICSFMISVMVAFGVGLGSDHSKID